MVNSTQPSRSKDAKAFDPDIHPWERQPGESDAQYAMYSEFRDMEDRRLAAFDDERYEGRSWTRRRAEIASSLWSWGYRNYCWDRYVGQVDTEDLVRYRRMMNARHRNIARGALNKFSVWLVNVDPNSLKPMEAARLGELAVAMERMAAMGELLVDADEPLDPDAPEGRPTTLRELAGIDPTVEADLAKQLHQFLQQR
jgi:hypothetical protein